MKHRYGLTAVSGLFLLTLLLLGSLTVQDSLAQSPGSGAKKSGSQGSGSQGSAASTSGGGVLESNVSPNISGNAYQGYGSFTQRPWQPDYNRNLENDWDGKLDHSDPNQQSVEDGSFDAKSRGQSLEAEEASSEGKGKGRSSLQPPSPPPQTPADLGRFYPRQVINDRLNPLNRMRVKGHEGLHARYPVQSRYGIAANMASEGASSGSTSKAPGQ